MGQLGYKDRLSIFLHFRLDSSDNANILICKVDIHDPRQDHGIPCTLQAIVSSDYPIYHILPLLLVGSQCHAP